MKENMKVDRRAKHELEEVKRKDEEKIELMEEQLEDQRIQIMEMKNESKVRAEHVASDKRTIEILKEKIVEIEQPAHYLREQVSMSELKAQKFKAESQDTQLKLQTYTMMVSQFEEENKSLLIQKNHLEDMNEVYKTRMNQAAEKCDNALEELNRNKGNFDNIDSIIKEKDDKIAHFTKKYKDTEVKMYEYELQNKHLHQENKDQKARIDELQNHYERMEDEINTLTKCKIDTEKKFDEEHEKNEKLFELLKDAELKVEDLESHQLNDLTQKLKEAELKIAKQDEELVLSKKAKDFAAAMHERAIIQKNEEVVLYQQRLKVAQRDLKQTFE